MSDAHKGKMPTNLADLIAFSRSEKGRRFNSERQKGKTAWNKGIGLEPDYVHVGKKGLEHRMVMEKHIGRKLESKEVVHHWDENKKNNDVKNLCLMRTTAAHTRLHHFARRHGIAVELLKFTQPWLVTSLA